MKTLMLSFILLGMAGYTASGAQPTAIVHAKVYPISGPVIEDGTILIRDGIIVEVGPTVVIPAGARVLDASGKSVFPGFIDANCHAGLEEINQVDATVDDLEGTDPVTPHMRVTDAFYPESKTLGVSRVNGVVACVVSPSATNVLSGISAVIEFSEKQIDQVILEPRAAANATLGEAPKAKYGAKEKMPESRMGTAALLRMTLQKAREYGEGWTRYNDKSTRKKQKAGEDPPPPARDLTLESLQDVLAGKMPFVVTAHRVDDILTALRIAEEFGIKQNLVINQGTDAYKIADVLSREKIPVLVGPVTTQPDRMETLGARYDNAALLFKAGVTIAIQTNETHNMRNLPYEAGLAVANGLPYEEALRAITINPAKIFHVDQKVGSIEKGKRANLIIAAGDPLEPRTVIEHVFIGGEELPDSSYHKQLWEEFQKSIQNQGQRR